MKVKFKRKQIHREIRLKGSQVYSLMPLMRANRQLLPIFLCTSCGISSLEAIGFSDWAGKKVPSNNLLHLFENYCLHRQRQDGDNTLLTYNQNLLGLKQTVNKVVLGVKNEVCLR